MPLLDPGTEGGTDYDGPYQILSNLPDVELVGVSDSVDVQRVTVRALTSRVIFSFALLPEVADLTSVNRFASHFAGYFDALAAIPGVGGISTFQDIDDSDELQDVMRIVVRSSSGRSAQAYIEPQFGRRPDYVALDVANIRAQLDAIDASH